MVYLFISTKTEDVKVSPSVLAGAAPRQQMSPSGAGCLGGAGSSFEMASGRAGGVAGVGTGGATGFDELGDVNLCGKRIQDPASGPKICMWKLSDAQLDHVGSFLKSQGPEPASR